MQGEIAAAQQREDAGRLGAGAVRAALTRAVEIYAEEAIRLGMDVVVSGDHDETTRRSVIQTIRALIEYERINTNHDPDDYEDIHYIRGYDDGLRRALQIVGALDR